MLNIKPLLLFSFLLSATINYGQFTDVINSNRPGESMGAFSVGKTVIQAELGASGYQEKNDIDRYRAYGFDYEVAVRYGAFFEQLEFIGEIQYRRENFTEALVLPDRSGLKQATIGAKFLIYDPQKNFEKKPNIYSWLANHKFNFRQFIPAVGIYAGLNIDFAQDKFSRPLIPRDPNKSPKLMLLTQNQFGRYALVANIIYDKFPYKKKSIDYVVTLTKGLNDRWSVFGEIQGFNGTYYSDAFFRVGAAFLVYENIQVDAAIATNYKDTPSILNGGIGLSWRFDANYSEIMLRIPKSKEKKGKDKEKKEKKDKAKKRIDEVEGEKTN